MLGKMDIPLQSDCELEAPMKPMSVKEMISKVNKKGRKYFHSERSRWQASIGGEVSIYLQMM